jgi:indole-3-glycerol phosphate synthase
MNSDILTSILDYTKDFVAARRTKHSLAELKSRILEAPPAQSLEAAFLDDRFGLIAEIKVKSPSMGSMRTANVAEAPQAYEAHPLVKAVSILTNERHFGMNIEELARLRRIISKPILRKDFIIDEYQIYEARAYGADAVLLMANVLDDRKKLEGMWNLCKELGMDALFECHTAEQIAILPQDARVCGINSRKLDSTSFCGLSLRYTFSKLIGKTFGLDYSPQLRKFELIDRLPHNVVKIAESGVSESTIAQVKNQGWNGALVGTALLMNSKGVRYALDGLSSALSNSLYNCNSPAESGKPHAAMREVATHA